MALIRCYECGKEISDRAPACPSCGAPAKLSSHSPAAPDAADKAPLSTPPKRPKGDPKWVKWLAAVCVVIILGVGGMIAASIYQHESRKGRPAAPVGPANPGNADGTKGGKTKFKRSEFRNLVSGKTPQQVLAAVGRPGDTADFDTGSQSWTYYSVTTDEVTGKTDTFVSVTFRNGIASDVLISP